MGLEGRLEVAAKLWEEGGPAGAVRPAWLRAWMALQVAKLLSGNKRWQKADTAFGVALKLAEQDGSCTALLVRSAWAKSMISRGDRAGAMKQYEQQLTEIEDAACASYVKSSVLLSLAIMHEENSDLAEAEEYVLRIVTIEQRLAPDINLANTLNILADISRQRGELGKAEMYAEQALELLEKISPDSLELASVLRTLGFLTTQRGDLDKAEVLLQRALTVAQRLAPKTDYVASTLTILGNLALDRGDLPHAEAYYRQGESIALFSALHSVTLAIVFVDLGWTLMEQGRFSKADLYCRKAVAMLQSVAPGSLYLAVALENTGDLLRRQGRLAKAAVYMREALAIRQTVAPDGIDVAESLYDLGHLTEDQGELDKAAEYYRRALVIREKLAPGSTAHADTLAGLASIMRRRGQVETAASYYEQALNALESQTARLGGSNDTRAGFRARHENYYRDYTDLLLIEGKTQEAFAVLERSRSRTLLETLATAHVDVRKGADPVLIGKQRSLQADIRAKSERRLRLLADQHADEQLKAVEKEISDLTSEYQDVESQLRATSPSYAALTQPQPLNSKEIQQLLDSETLLLEYSLGQDRSHVFAVTPDSLAAFELPKRAEIEKAARRVYGLLATRDGSVRGETQLERNRRMVREEAAYNKAATALSRMVLAPVVGQLHDKRLLIVADGALHYIPFAALSEPILQVSLVFNHEIVNLPSASVLAVLRREEDGRKPSPKAVAVLADPVFTRNDARVRSRAFTRTGISPAVVQSLKTSEQNDELSSSFSAGLLTRSVTDVGLGRSSVLRLPRLPFSRREADAIMAVTPEGMGMKAVDFDANREAATSPELAQYRMVHFATHGLLDSQHPELSGLVLSLVDTRGRRKDGFLQLGDIYNLNLPADLVVLSACETGLGKEVNGEGLIGLTRGFMYAGATRVVSSLWKVDDFATAKLMQGFYKSMEQEGMRPAQALRNAQLSMINDRRWSAPYYWAGFTIQGEWR
jgi:CHAT domain-containing protein/Tfp pilus assembly protein PilF